MRQQPRRPDRVRVVSYLPADLVEKIDSLARERDVSRSVVVASLLEQTQTSEPRKRTEPTPETRPEPPPREPVEFKSEFMRRKREG
jgi:hypothetical protein